MVARQAGPGRVSTNAGGLQQGLRGAQPDDLRVPLYQDPHSRGRAHDEVSYHCLTG